VRTILDQQGRIDVLVNNAGFGLYGAAEDVPLEQARYQLEVNLFGPARLTQLVLPHMRKQRSGTIVNVSSMGGEIAFPLGAWYHASKHALEAYSDALRYEVRGFGVDVVLIEPGIIRTAFGDTATTELARTPDGPYTEFRDGVARRMRLAYSGWMAALSTGPETVAGTIERAVSAERPKTRYRITPAARMALLTRRLSTDRMFDAMLRLFFPASGRTK
jgi:short-subunit dehydrogenase